MQEQNNCPYCNMLLGFIPQRNRKCPSCGQLIFARTRPGDRQRIFVTEKGAKQIKKQWTKIREGKERAIRIEVAIAQRNSLHRYKQEGISQVEIISSPDSCPQCLALSNKKFPIDKVPLLPLKSCTNKNGCRCCYIAVID